MTTDRHGRRTGYGHKASRLLGCAAAGAAMLLAVAIPPSQAEAVDRDDATLFGFFDDPSTLSQTLMFGLRARGGEAALLFSCDAEKQFFGGLVVPNVDPNDLGNAVRVTGANGRERAFRGRAIEVPGQMQFDGAAARGAYFISGPDNLRMRFPANMRFIGAVLEPGPVSIEIVNGAEPARFIFETAPHLELVERVANHCDRTIGQ